jgi:glutamyl-tRNA synthetase
VPLAKEFLPKDLAGPPLERVIDLVKDRAATVRQLADEAAIFYARDIPKEAVAGPTRDALLDLRGRLEKVSWERSALSAAIKESLAATRMKMPQLAMPLRQVLTGRTQTPSIDAVLELLGRDTVLQRLKGI